MSRWLAKTWETTVPGIYAAGDVSGIEEASSAMVEEATGRLRSCQEASATKPEKASSSAEKRPRLKLSELRSGPTGAKILAGLEKNAAKLAARKGEAKGC